MGNVSVINSSSFPFLGDYEIEKVEVVKSDDKGNGEAIVRFSVPYKGYTMTINLVNGKKEGVGSIKREDGTPYMQVMFVNDECEGEVIKTDRYGSIVLRGRLEGGREVGMWTEYDFGKEKWRGFYRSGKRYSTVIASRDLDGMFEEIRSDGELLSISGFDVEWRRHGRCFEYENGRVKSECEYENGIKTRTIREFTDRRLMRVYLRNGKKAYEGVWYGDVVNGFSRYPRMLGMKGFYSEINRRGEVLSVSEYDEYGLLKNGRCFEYERGRVKRECVYENGRVMRVLREWTEDLMVEYDDNGMKVYEGGFEGEIVKGFVRGGKGTEYGNNGKKLYFGDWRNGYRDGEGTEYGSDGESALYVGSWENGTRYGFGSEFCGYCLYTGEWKNGMRHGIGKEMNEKGEVIYDGEWMDGKVISKSPVAIQYSAVESNYDGSQKSGSILAIDFGSSNSVAFLLKNGNAEQISDNTEQGLCGFPSLVEYLGNRILTATVVKKRRQQARSTYSVSCVKRILGLTWDQYNALETKDIFGCEVVRGADGYPRFVVSGDGRQVSPIEVAAELFRKIKFDADARNDAPVTDCFVTVPANYKENQRGAIKEAARMAGLDVKAIIIEPTAAAMSWCFDHQNEVALNDKMLVFDFGGGTLDLSLLNYDGNGEFSVIDTDGDPKLGGYDIDLEIRKEVCRRVDNLDLSSLRDRCKSRLLAVCEDMKIQLSVTSGCEIDLSDIVDDDETRFFTQADLNVIVNNLCMDRINHCLNRLMNKPGRSLGMIKRVLMVGGSSRILAVKEALHSRFHNAIFPSINPETSGAQGALSIARRPDIVHDIISYSYGLRLSDDQVIILLPRGTQIPCESEPITFSSDEDYPDKIYSIIYQWNDQQSNETGGTKPISECTMVQEYCFKNEHPLPSGESTFTITFYLSVGGTLEVVCIDSKTGNVMNHQVYNSLIQIQAG